MGSAMQSGHQGMHGKKRLRHDDLDFELDELIKRDSGVSKEQNNDSLLAIGAQNQGVFDQSKRQKRGGKDGFNQGVVGALGGQTDDKTQRMGGPGNNGQFTGNPN